MLSNGTITRSLSSNAAYDDRGLTSPSTPSSRPTTPPHSNSLEPGRLYAVLSYRGDLASWNWAFFVPDPTASPVGSRGTIFRVVSAAEHELGLADGPAAGIAVACVPPLDVVAGGRFAFEMGVRDIISSPLTVAIVRLGDLESLGAYEEVVGGDGLELMFRTVAIPTSVDPSGVSVRERHDVQFSSRTWFLEAICVLHDCGVVNCDDVWMLERELRRCAFSAMDGYLQSQGWSAYTSERCS